jgi:hypothetical protein
MFSRLESIYRKIAFPLREQGEGEIKFLIALLI